MRAVFAGVLIFIAVGLTYSIAIGLAGR